MEPREVAEDRQDAGRGISKKIERDSRSYQRKLQAGTFYHGKQF
jgi:hypothetical protein